MLRQGKVEIIMKIRLMGVLIILLSISVSSIQAQSVDVNRVRGVAWSPDGTRIARVDNRGVTQIISVQSGQVMTSFTSDNGYTGAVDWHPTNVNRLATGGKDGLIKIWDSNTGQLITTLFYPTERTDDITSVKWSPDGSKIARSNYGGAITVWSTSDNSQIVDIPSSQVTSLSWQSTGTHLVAVAGVYLRIWNIGASQTPSILQYDNGIPTSVDWSQYNGLIASGGADVDRDIRIWNPTTGQVVRVLDGHTDQILSVAWSPNSDQLASASVDGTVRIWNTTIGYSVQVINVGSQVEAVAWSPDGTKIAYGGASGVFGIVAATLSSIPSPTSSPMPTSADFTPSATPNATALLRFFNPPTCARTCLIGIQPGITTLTEFKAILASRNITYFLNSMDGSEDNAAFEWYLPLSDTGFMQGANNQTFVNTTFANGIVRQMTVGLDIPIRSIIAAYGQPPQYASRRSAYFMIYDEYKIIFQARETYSTEVVTGVFLVDGDLLAEYINDTGFSPVSNCAQATGICSVQTATPTPSPDD